MNNANPAHARILRDTNTEAARFDIDCYRVGVLEGLRPGQVGIGYSYRASYEITRNDDGVFLITFDTFDGRDIPAVVVLPSEVASRRNEEIDYFVAQKFASLSVC